jgi:hypothetical protein
LELALAINKTTFLAQLHFFPFFLSVFNCGWIVFNCDFLVWMSKPYRSLGEELGFSIYYYKEDHPQKKWGGSGLPFTLYHCRSNITVYICVYIYILWCISYVSIILVINGDYCKEEKHWWNQFNTLLATPLQLGAAWNGGSEVV